MKRNLLRLLACVGLGATPVALSQAAPAATIAAVGTSVALDQLVLLNYETATINVNYNSLNVLENVDTNIVDAARDWVNQVGRLPHKIKYTWRFYGGHGALMIRAHFSKFKLGAASLKMGTASGTVAQTLTGTGPTGGWSNWVNGTGLTWTLDTNSVTFPDSSYGFAIDQIQIYRSKISVDSAVNLGATNREWYGAISPNADHYLVVQTSQSGRHDFYVESLNTIPVNLYVAAGTALPSTTGTGADWKREGAAVSKVLADKTLGVGTYTIRLRNVSASPASYLFMLNRVIAVLNLEVEMSDDWSLPSGEWSKRRCEIQQMFRSASERLYAATDGYMRFGKVYYFSTSYALNDVDAVIEPEDVRANAMFWQWGHINLGWNHLNFYAADCGYPAATPSSNGGATFVHEWGHYDFEIWDEYHDVDSGGSVSLCPYSLMGSSSRWDFCTSVNHNHNDGAAWQIGQGDTPAWATVRDDYGSIPSSKLSSTANPHRFNKSAVRDLVQFRENLTCDELWLIGPTGFGPDCE